jgi:hypothetical protein
MVYDRPQTIGSPISLLELTRGHWTRAVLSPNRKTIMQVLTGRCLCEGIAYEITGELGPIFHCHCSKCRRWHGAAFRSRATIKASQFRWTQGEALVARYQASEQVVKHFCSVCGANLISTYSNLPDKIGVPLGGLEQAPTNAPEGHIFVNSKSPWFEITDDLPQHDAWPGSEAKVREASDDVRE